MERTIMENLSIEKPSGEPTQFINGAVSKEVSKKDKPEKKAMPAQSTAPEQQSETATASIRIEVPKTLVEQFNEYAKLRGPITAEELEEKAKAKAAAAYAKMLTDTMQGDEPFQKRLAGKKSK
jgi:hypothetical protein